MSIVLVPANMQDQITQSKPSTKSHGPSLGLQVAALIFRFQTTPPGTTPNRRHMHFLKAITSFGNKFCLKKRSRLIRALDNRFYVKFMQLEICLLFWFLQICKIKSHSLSLQLNHMVQALGYRLQP